MSQASLPVYCQIANKLRRDIVASVYRLGERLPTEMELSDRFGVNRHTLRRAISVLENEGLVKIDRGRGMFVTAVPITIAIDKQSSDRDSLEAQGFQVRRQLLQTAELVADATLAKQLEISIGRTVVLLEWLSFADRLPVSITSSYFPDIRFPGLAERCLHYASTAELLQREYDCLVQRRSTTVSVQSASVNDVKWLELPPHAAVLLSESTYVDRQNQVIEYGVTRFRGDRMQLMFAS